jgi:hypothetical protein
MADSKITALTALTAADPANDMIPIVDVSDTPPASGNTKRISINNILACSPSATLASATITGDLTVNTNVLKVDSTNDRVGIGTASPTAQFHIVAPGSDSAVVRLQATGGRTFDIFSSAAGYGSANNLIIYDITGSAERYRIDSTGVHTWQNVGGVAGTGLTLNATSNLVLRGGTAGANGVGLTFPATQVASSDANCLDDYEEGTWTGTLKGSVSDPTIAVTATGAYTKVGRLVTATINFSNVLTTGASGDVTIAGLPFTGAASSAGSVITFSMFTTSTTLACWNTGTTIAFYVSGTFTPATHNAGASRSVNVTITYYV